MVMMIMIMQSAQVSAVSAQVHVVFSLNIDTCRWLQT